MMCFDEWNQKLLKNSTHLVRYDLFSAQKVTFIWGDGHKKIYFVGNSGWISRFFVDCSCPMIPSKDLTNRTPNLEVPDVYFKSKIPHL